MKVFDFTDKAERDLESIIDFTVEQWGNSQAIQYIDGMEETAQMLADNPGIGLKRDSLSEDLFSFPFQSHNLYYFENSTGITIIRVLHVHMDPEKQLG